MYNILTIDVEDYFQVYAFSDVIKFEDWGNFECRIERNTDRLLEILDGVTQNSKFKTQNSKLDHSLTQRAKATFFVLGWNAERYPSLVRRIQKEGHEIACHGYAHKRIYTQSKEEFRQDIRRAKAILEDITGCEVIGYRAPNYSITNKSQWAFDVLVEEGFKYDSSVFPIRHDVYGMPDAPRFPFVISLNGNNNFEFSVLSVELGPIQNSTLITQNSRFITQNSNFSPQSSVLTGNSFPHSLIHPIPDHSKLITQNSKLRPHNSQLNTQTSQFIIEFPVSTVRLLGQNFPISGGGYFRLFPYSFIRKGLMTINQKERKPFIFYVHPWEFDTDQPRIKGAASLSKFRHYVNLHKTEIRFKKLLSDFQFSTIQQLLIQTSQLKSQS